MRQPIKVNEIQVGDCLSEISHYVVKQTTKDTIKFNHLESGEEVELSNQYVENLLDSAEQYHQEVKVGKVDKYWTAAKIQKAGRTDVREGDVEVEGIRTIWDNIHSSQVFTVCFEKQGKPLSKKAYEARKNEVISKAIESIEKARTNKKSITDAAKQEFENLITNPVLNYEPGEERVLRGYKLQYKSNSGFYDVLDMDLNETRKVNINTLKWIVFKGVKYIVE